MVVFCTDYVNGLNDNVRRQSLMIGMLDLIPGETILYSINNRTTILYSSSMASLSSEHVQVIVHSDRGSQYANHQYCDAPKDNSLRCSMNGEGSSYDNAVMENSVNYKMAA